MASKAFPQYSWSGLVGDYKNDEVLRAKVDKALAVQSGTDTLPGPAEQITHDTWVGLEVKRDVILLNERELKRTTGLDRLSKKALKGVPSFEIPKEDGAGQEIVWAFKDPQFPLRRGCVKVMQGSSLKQWALESEDALFVGQGQELFPHYVAQVGGKVGLKDFVDKEARGASQMVCLDEFMEANRPQLADDHFPGGEVEDEGLSMANALREAEVKFVGPAAQSSQLEPFATPEPTKKKASPCIARTASSSSLGHVANPLCEDGSDGEAALGLGEAQSCLTGAGEGGSCDSEYSGLVEVGSQFARMT